MATRAGPTGAPVEWPTVALIALTYAVWLGVTAGLFGLPGWVAWPVLTLAISLHMSLTHEVSHGHPTRHRWLNELMVMPALALTVPVARYRDTHLAHHYDPHLTDPYDDPESNYLDPAIWHRLPAPARALLRWNNTLLGRVLLGPALSTLAFWRGEARLILAGDRSVRHAWAWHVPAVAMVAAWLALAGQVSWLFYGTAVYAAIGLQKIRSYLEHRAHHEARARTVIVERGGLLGALFLNNHLHAVHHAHPRVPWYRLPALWRERRAVFLARNDGYAYPSYGTIARQHLLSPKDPVPHPLWTGADAPVRAADRPADAPLPAAAAVSVPRRAG